MNLNDYIRLEEHYKEVFFCFDAVHFNSSVTEKIYKKNLDIRDSSVIPITHNNIEDNRKDRAFNTDILHLIFIGNTTTYKGFPMLQEVLLELYEDGVKNWRLDVWGADGASECSSIHFNGSYNVNELERVFHTDGVLVVPSVWHETFSLITLEALSFGVPTLVSSTVGAKDIVKEYDSWFVFDGKIGLKKRLLELMSDKTRLRAFNRAIMENAWHHSLSDHAQEIIKLYEK